jgi:hypothetical protein
MIKDHAEGFAAEYRSKRNGIDVPVKIVPSCDLGICVAEA